MNREEYVQNLLANVEAISKQHDIPWLAALRIYRGVTQHEMAALTGLHFEGYVNLECTTNPKPGRLRLALTTLGLPDDLLDQGYSKQIAA